MGAVGILDADFVKAIVSPIAKVPLFGFEIAIVGVIPCPGWFQCRSRLYSKVLA
jgi:hypothetical protein